jgi:hypothetical protein
MDLKRSGMSCCLNVLSHYFLLGHRKTMKTWFMVTGQLAKLQYLPTAKPIWLPVRISVLQYSCFFTFSSIAYHIADHGDREVQGINWLRSLERWDRGFESYSRHECLCVRLFCVCVVCVKVATLRQADPPSKEFYRLCKNDYETEKEARAQQRAVEPLMNEWTYLIETIKYNNSIINFLHISIYIVTIYRRVKNEYVAFNGFNVVNILHN